jgi:ribosomal protein L32
MLNTGHLERQTTTGPAPQLIACRKCGTLVRPRRVCWRCGLETPPPWRNHGDIAAKIVNTVAALVMERAS